MVSGKQAKFDFKFVVPAERLLSVASQSIQSEDQDVRDVAKALLDTTEVTVKMQSEMKEKFGLKGNCYLAPYFDHWIGDALDAAQRLRSSDDESIRHMAECLIDQSNAIIHSKESFLNETKRLL